MKDQFPVFMDQVLEAEKALEIIFSRVQGVESERVSLGMARGAVLRETIVADEDIPPFHRSAMDGYVLIRSAECDFFECVEEIASGSVPQKEMTSGHCSRIFTGGMIPRGANQVIPQEFVEREGNRIKVKEWPASSFIRFQGEDAPKGEILLEPGIRLGAADLAVLASVGVTWPLISMPVRVVHFTSGHEIISPDQKPEPGQIRNSNAILIEALLSEAGTRLIHQGHLPEDFGKSMDLVGQIESDEFDLLLISGGASVGDYDFSKKILEELGFQLVFQTLNLRPGKPLVFGVRGKQLAFAIPGNPVSHYVIFQRFLKPLISQMERGNSELEWREGILDEDWEGMGNSRPTLWPARVEWNKGGYHLVPLKWNSSGDVRGLIGCGGLIDVKPGKKFFKSQEKVLFMKVGH